MAIHSAGLFLLLSAGVLAVRPDRGIAAVFTEPEAAGQIARRVLPASAILTVVIAWIRLYFERRGFYGTGFGLAIFTSTNVATFSILIGLAARSLAGSFRRLDSVRRDLALSHDHANLTNSRLAAIIESSDDAIISKTLEGTITSWNASAERIFGYSSSEAVGQSMRMLIPPDHLFEETDILRRIADGQSVTHFEAVRVRKDGVHIFVSVAISPLRDVSGVIIGASKIARDVTETRRIERSVQEQEARLTAIIGSAMDAVITVNAELRITMFNPAAETMFGCKANVALGSSLDTFIPQRFRADHAQHVRNFGETNTTRRKMGRMGSIYGIRSNGEEFPIEASISQTEVRGEKLFTVILRDVTDRRRADEEFRQQAALLDLAPVLVRDMDSRIVLWTRGAQHLYGYSKEEAIGQSSHELLQAEFPASREQSLFGKAFHRGGSWEGQLRHRTRDGRTVFVYAKPVGPSLRRHG